MFCFTCPTAGSLEVLNSVWIVRAERAVRLFLKPRRAGKVPGVQAVIVQDQHDADPCFFWDDPNIFHGTKYMYLNTINVLGLGFCTLVHCLKTFDFITLPNEDWAFPQWCGSHSCTFTIDTAYRLDWTWDAVWSLIFASRHYYHFNALLLLLLCWINRLTRSPPYLYWDLWLPVIHLLMSQVEMLGFYP